MRLSVCYIVNLNGSYLFSALTNAEKQANYRKRKAALDPDYIKNESRKKEARKKVAFEKMSPGQKADVRMKNLQKVRKHREKLRRYLSLSFL